MYLPAGLYEFSVYEWSPYNEGHKVKSTTMTVSSGQTVTGYSFYLERSKTPIPEFGAVIALVASRRFIAYCAKNKTKKLNAYFFPVLC